MLLELIVLGILIALSICIVCICLRYPRARARADRIIAGQQPATEEDINKLITVILSTKNWITDITEADRQRVDRLRDMRKETVTPHD